MAGSDDGITYSPMTAGASQYFRSMRFLKLRLEFASEDDNFIELYNLRFHSMSNERTMVVV